MAQPSPFDWLDPTIPDDYKGTFSEKGKEMQRREIRERTAVLMRLGHSREEAIARCRQNMYWEHDLHRQPSVFNDIEQLVDEVYSRK